MFETESFREQIEKAIIREASRNYMTEYEPAIVPYLQRLASDNESILMERELRKVASERRGIEEALRSVAKLTREASQNASSEGRKVLHLSDIQNAYKAKFCQFWPFCKS
jgi:hypothetical protein